MYLFSVSRSFVQSSLVMAAPADLSASSSAAVASPASGAVVVAPSPRPPKPKRPKQPPSFAVCKRNALSKLDKSPKGSIDAPILPLVRALYGHAGYVTTSSCSGRIALYETIPPNSNKNWSSSQQFSPKKRFFALFQQNNVEKNSLKTGIIIILKKRWPNKKLSWRGELVTVTL